MGLHSLYSLAGILQNNGDQFYLPSSVWYEIVFTKGVGNFFVKFAFRDNCMQFVKTINLIRPLEFR